MKVDQALNLVSTVSRDTFPVYVYVTPLPYEVIEEHHAVLGSVFTQFYQTVGGLGAVRVAAMMLRKALREFQDGVPTLVDEIARFTNVMSWNGKKWQTTPLELALNSGVITNDEWREVEGEVVFFIVGSAIQKRELIPAMVGNMLSAYGAQLTPLGCTAYSASLPTSKTEETPAEDAAIPSVTETQYIPS